MGIFTSRVWPEPLTALREEWETWTLENHSVLQISFKSLIIEVSTHPKCACGSTLFTNPLHPGIFEILGHISIQVLLPGDILKFQLFERWKFSPFPQNLHTGTAQLFGFLFLWGSLFLWHSSLPEAERNTGILRAKQAGKAADLVIYSLIYLFKKQGNTFWSN